MRFYTRISKKNTAKKLATEREYCIGTRVRVRANIDEFEKTSRALKCGSYRELEEIVRAKASQVELADIAVVVIAVDLSDVAVAVGAHEDVQLLADRVHGCLCCFYC